MRYESTSVKDAKAHIREQIEVAFQIPLPEWLEEGAKLSELRYIQALLDSAHQRYMTEGVPTRDPRVQEIK